jgi:hypothetical protein
MKINASSLNLKYIHIFHEIMTGNQNGHFSRKILTHSAKYTHHLVGIMFSEACVVIVYVSQSACGMYDVEQHAVK